MAGLLDGFMDDPTTMGLLGMAGGLLSAGGPSLVPHSTGQGLFAGFEGMNKAYGGVKQRLQDEQANAQNMQMNGLKIDGMKQQQLQQATMLALQNRIKQRLGGDPQAAQQMGAPAASSLQDTPASAMPGGPMSPKIGGPDWMQSYQQSQPQQPMAPQMAPQAPAQPQGMSTDGLGTQVASQLIREADIRRQEGDFDGANKLYEQATKYMPKFATDFRQATGPDGKLHNYQLADNGQRIDSGLGVKPEMTEVDLGGTKQFVDKNSVTNGQTFARTQTPDSIVSSSIARQRLNFDQQQANSNQDESMDPLAIRMTAQQYLAGDTSALQNFGRGAQGAKNLNAVRLEITRQANAAGMTGADVAAKVAEFGGLKAGQRTAGTRSANIEIAANEVAQLAPIALDASAKVARSGFLPFGKAQILFDSNTNDPNLRQFAMANTALVNAYGQAMARGGSATVSDKDHARELLSTAMDQPSYNAAVKQLQVETRAAQAAPKAVRKDLSNSLTGRDEQPTKVATLSDIAETARRSGKSTKQVTADLQAAGYSIGGQ